MFSLAVGSLIQALPSMHIKKHICDTPSVFLWDEMRRQTSLLGVIYGDGLS